MDSTSDDLYNKLVSCIKQNQVKQSNRLIIELKQKEKMKNRKLIKLFKHTKPRHISYKIRQSLITNLMQPVLASLELNKNHPLWITVGCGDFKSLKLLLDSHTFDLDNEIDVCNNNNHSLLYHAVVQNYRSPKDCIQIIDSLLQHGAKVNEPDNMLLCKTIVNDCWSREVADFLFERGATNVHARKTTGYTLLHHTVYEKQNDRVEWLLDHGIDVNTKTDNGLTPLSFAAYNNDRTLVKLLLQRGANVNQRLHDNETVMHKACYDFYCNVSLVKLLLEFGAKVDVQDSVGVTPFAIALETDERNNPVVSLLIKEFAKIKFKEEIDPLQEVTNLTDLQLIDQNYPKLKVFYDKCLKELRKMNGIILDKSISMYEILFIRNSHQLALFLKREEFAQLFYPCNITTSFPLYGLLLLSSDKIKEASVLKKAMDELDDKLYSTIGAFLPDVVMRKIVKLMYQYELEF